MKKNIGKYLIASGILALFIGLGFIPGLTAVGATRTMKTMEFTQQFSTPTLTECDDYLRVSVAEANSVLTTERGPVMPQYTKTVVFPLGVKVISVDVTTSSVRYIVAEKQVQPVPVKQKVGTKIISDSYVKNNDIYKSSTPYPNTWCTYTTGAGLDQENNHVLFLSVHLSPVQYLPGKNLLQYVGQITVQVTYEEPDFQPTRSDAYQLVVISPSEFSENLQPLVAHKNTFGITATQVTLEDIYASYPGRDNSEKIKFFVKHAVDDWDTNYVLLVGDVKKLPIRVTYASWWEDNLLSDLYYADLYNAQDEFCSWDSNNNSRFGETTHDGGNIDGVDLYADVNIGRLPCSTLAEVDIVVNKIITYETSTAGQTWFNNFIVAGGDTFPVGMGAESGVFEGEITNEVVLEQVSEFTPIKLWSSERSLSAKSFNKQITNGAGFVSYAGHGFEHGWGTYRPNALRSKMIPFLDPVYFTPYLKNMNNGDKLPVMFWDACLTSKLDFNVTDLENYYPTTIKLLTGIGKLNSDPSVYYPCFAWSLLKKEGGGAIATVGSTRTAYTWVDSTGVYGGAGYLDVSFFKGYTAGVTVGEMLTFAQNEYINNVEPDYFTIEEFILFGDPSLRVGGFPGL